MDRGLLIRCKERVSGAEVESASSAFSAEPKERPGKTADGRISSQASPLTLTDHCSLRKKGPELQVSLDDSVVTNVLIRRHRDTLESLGNGKILINVMAKLITSTQCVITKIKYT